MPNFFNDSDESTSDEYDSDEITSDENDSVSRESPSLTDSGGSTSDENCADTYEMKKFKKNLLILFYHKKFSDKFKTRSGTEHDEISLRNTFMKLNFKCSIHKDLRKHQILKKMAKYGEKDFTNYGCVFVAIMTHGDQHGQLHAYDYTYSEYDLLKRITRNRTLTGKPVVFLIQASRGIVGSNMENMDDHISFQASRGIVGSNMENMKTSGIEKLPTNANVLLFYSSSVGCPSFSRREGGCFIQSVCKQIHLRTDQEDFLTICSRATRELLQLKLETRTSVGDRVKILQQHPVLTTTFIRRLYLGPVRKRNITSYIEQILVKESYSVAVSYPDLNASTYELEKKKKNLMIIFSHENFLNNTGRESSAADAKKLKSTFEEFGFEVTTHKDETMTELFSKLTAFSRQDFGACGCVCVAVLTHGSAHGFLEACDVGYSERALFAAFDALANRSLAGKPIVFLIQASRGAKPAGRICVPRLDEVPDSSIQLDAADGSQHTYQIKYLPTEANMIIFHSCFGGRAVPKDDRSGSCFVQTLCEQVRRHGASEHLEKIFRRVRRLVAETSAQMPVTTSTLLKKLFLQRNNPALSH